MYEKIVNCYECGKVIFLLIDDNNNAFLKRKTGSIIKPIKLTNIRQIPNTKYFCKQFCKNNYFLTVKKDKKGGERKNGTSV